MTLGRADSIACPTRSRPARRVAWLWSALALTSLCIVAGTARAVVIDSGDGSGNTSPPNDNPGLVSVGAIGPFGGVYVGNRWVLTANHVGAADLTIAGQTFSEVPGSKHRLTTPGGGLADLKLVKFDGDPGLPNMNIASSSPSKNGIVVMYGQGWNRISTTTWEDPDGLSHDGYLTGGGKAFRWGDNRVEGFFASPVLDTEAYFTTFDESGATTDECQAVQGDSGGGVFYKRFGTWELSGIMFASIPYVEQPANLALYGNGTIIADLSKYRAEILGVINTPTCSDGLDDDGDGLTDYPEDPGCSSANDSDERDANLVCDDGVDQDGDGLVDWPEDPGCSDSADTSEQSASLLCDDGLDNEGDGLTDHTEDPECTSPTAPSEGPAPYVPVTSGLGAGVLMAMLGAFGRHRGQP